jgi:hypothetical protein
MRTLLSTWMLIVMLAACARAPHDEREEPAALQTGVSAAQWLANVRAAHASADAAHTAQARGAALTALQALAAGAAPGALSARDGATVRRDLHAHAARLALDLERFELANALIRQGLTLEGSDPFRTQLLLLDVETQRALRDTAAEAAALRAARSVLARE